MKVIDILETHEMIHGARRYCGRHAQDKAHGNELLSELRHAGQREGISKIARYCRNV